MSNAQKSKLKEATSWPCEKDRLNNEASVEAFFLNRFIDYLKWDDSKVRLKESIETFLVSKGGRKKENYKPDYILLDEYNKPYIVIDAKGTNEDIHDFIHQCSGYSLSLNQEEESVKYFILSNGLLTELYGWKGGTPILSLSFEDFSNKSDIFRQLITIITAGKRGNSPGEKKNEYITIKQINKEDAQKIFKKCHKDIWNAEKCGVNFAFMQFVKLIFLKMQSDKIVHEKYCFPKNSPNMRVKKDDVLFSEYWVEKNTNDFCLNPVNELQFKSLMDNLEKDIKKKKKKPLFNKDEQIELKAGTIKKIIKNLEKNDLYGIDEDLNGRLFETFLNATMRGNDLGQYFTPRSIVKLGVALADIRVSDEHIDKVIDASCGTGGYLIEAFAQMKARILANNSYSDLKKQELIGRLCSNSIFGIDAAKDPKLARIARINMYLHGDGGSQIYMGDALNKKMSVDLTDSQEFQDEMEEMKDVFKEKTFDVVVTNPPFSMEYTAKDPEQLEILKKYDMAKTDTGFRSLRAGVMFIERYYGLLNPGGKLITVIDNTILNSDQYSYVRDYIREHFIIKAIISLHGDAFQQSKARVKTSLIYLEKKQDLSEKQPDVFMTFSTCLGVDDKPITTSQSIIQKEREKAEKEIKKILSDYDRFKRGEKGEWRIPPERVTGKLDVKNCFPLKGRYVQTWVEKGYEVKRLSDIFTPVEGEFKPSLDGEAEEYKILTIKYDGYCSNEEIRLGADIQGKGTLVKEGNIVFSQYNAYYGAIGYVSKEYVGSFASSSYIVLNPTDKVDGIYAWSVLRTTEIRADILDSAVGMGRSPIKWDNIKDVQVPFIKDRKKRKEIACRVEKSWEKIKKAKQEVENVKTELGDIFGTETPESLFRFEANKPPK
ncbi:MAG: N-6 DNA methylase [Bacteroidales bacterium]|nr:N-6 DNA methylase [Bacteroidales bacterium]